MMQSARVRLFGFFASVIGLASFAASFVACASTDERSGFGPDNGGSSSGSGGDGGVFGGNGDAAGPALDENGCAEAAKLVYVLSYEGDLYSFAPAEKKFKKIGPLSKCNLSDKQLPISMAVDRKGTAWVNIATASASGRTDTLYKVDTSNADCEPTNIKSSYIGGMGFSSEAGDKEKETLFVFGQSGSAQSPVRTLDHVDFDKETVVKGPQVTNDVSELTGTGDGHLYGFIIKEAQVDQNTGKPQLDNLLSITELNKSTGKDSAEVVLEGVKYPHDPGFAFSFWGGDFYVYSAPLTIPPDYPFSSPPDDLKDEPTTDVARYSPATKKTEPAYMKAIGFHIVGAGVSTCAPTTGVH